ncbi:MAG: class I SAM-dependent methyltransferase [Deltaproteobacteria bacterium]|nr:class I SAM-dependent methyltransferase [Deltaproteobacteria bacterium]
MRCFQIPRSLLRGSSFTENIERLLNADRIKELNPAQFLIQSGLKKGMSFADIGCGPGFFTMPAAAIVGDSGVVYAVDVQEEMLNKLKQRRPSANLRIVKSQENLIPIESDTVDIALLAFVVHEVNDRVVFLKEVKRLLRADGNLLVLEWKKMVEDNGPPIEERIDENEASAVMESAAFKIADIFNLNISHYVIRATK